MQGIRRGTGGAHGRESETREYPMRTRETPWQPETGSTLNGAPPFIEHRAATQSQMTGIEREEREGGAPVCKYLNECKNHWRLVSRRLPPAPSQISLLRY